MNDRQPPKSFRVETGARGIPKDVDAELEFHIAMRTAKLVESGLNPAQAREKALEMFGNLPAIRSECLSHDQERVRSMHRKIYLGDLRQDIGHALRVVRGNPGFTTVLLLILALRLSYTGLRLIAADMDNSGRQLCLASAQRLRGLPRDRELHRVVQ